MEYYGHDLVRQDSDRSGLVIRTLRQPAPVWLSDIWVRLQDETRVTLSLERWRRRTASLIWNSFETRTSLKYGLAPPRARPVAILARFTDHSAGRYTVRASDRWSGLEPYWQNLASARVDSRYLCSHRSRVCSSLCARTSPPLRTYGTTFRRTSCPAVTWRTDKDQILPKKNRFVAWSCSASTPSRTCQATRTDIWFERLGSCPVSAGWGWDLCNSYRLALDVWKRNTVARYGKVELITDVNQSRSDET